VSQLRDHGLLCVVFTNQPDIARGSVAIETVERMHAILKEHIPVDDVYMCVHDSDDGCTCRKPLPGMLTAAAERWNVDLFRSFVVGDRWRDIDAGRAAGCYSILLRRSYSACTSADTTVDTLAQAVEVILERASAGGSEPLLS
jgi:D-glycero-D-manno-heptose 1,7-bisphosphate phosphatase